MVQKRQFRHKHVDAHYCAAISRYMREYALLVRDLAIFVSLDDKHRIKVGEPGYPKIGNKSVLFVYTDGGPDHRLTFFAVQLALVALFLNLNLDLLVVGRTAPNHSWRNPVERLMSVINLGLQCVGMM